MSNSTLQELNITTDYLIYQKERPLFEENYIKCGGGLHYLKWGECADQIGLYHVDWDAISDAEINDPEFDEDIQEHAANVTSNLHTWVQCAKSKVIPDGWILAPKEPNEQQKRTAMFVTSQQGNVIEAYKAMLADLDKTNSQVIT